MTTKKLATNREIVTRVRRLLSDADITSPAVPVDKVARHLGLNVQYAAYDNDLSGCLIRTKNQAIVGVNLAHHPNRQRFTIAHEIGHFLLHEGEEIFVDRGFRVNRRDWKSSTAEKPEEIEANRFASELLIPWGFLTKDLQKPLGRNPDIEQDALISELSHRYQVSFQAMMYKLVNVGFLPPLNRVLA